MIILLYIIGFIIMSLFELPALIINKYWREVVAFLGLSTLAFLLGLLMILQVNIPNPVEAITMVIENFLDLVSI